MSNADMLSVFVELWSGGRDARSLIIHTNKYIITNCIRCFEGKAQGAMQLNNKEICLGPRSQERLP